MAAELEGPCGDLQEISAEGYRALAVPSGWLPGIFSMQPSVCLRFSRSHLIDEPVQHTLLSRPVKVDRQLVALDRGNVAVAELDVKHPVADREFRGFVDL